ncbi:MAG: type III-B CRISPR module RAMP protein Cmr1 [Aphanocapsa lilacina HA4352-LM1]|jgi:CRISPR-associated protein Cmr6|nr:type III-B CRISPR module RAMP protein Cmr1 [Aphanocapsa lilacina HA4352-LM1]
MSFERRRRPDERDNLPQQKWQDYLKTLSIQKPRPPAIYEVLRHSTLASASANTLVLLFPSDELRDAARMQVQSIKARLPSEFKCERVLCQLKIAVESPEQTNKNSSAQMNTTAPTSTSRNPFQSLIFNEYGKDRDGSDLVQPVLEAAAKDEQKCEALYSRLNERTHKLAGLSENILTVRFPWRLRVGGLRGFRDLLLPVLHPIYGVPYIPASSLKGAARAWARKHHDQQQIEKLLGSLEGGVALVEIFDAFPARPCLSTDMANPQWSWEGERVKYGPSPHALLTMNQPELVIGLAPTRRGEQSDVALVKQWLQEALSEGLGSRVSAGYGRTGLKPALSHSKSYNFGLWTQGMYGAEPNRTAEFRPTAIRGVLRYWFRAIALGLYPSQQARDFEEELFGSLGVEGNTRLAMHGQSSGGGNRPYVFEGELLLEAKDIGCLQLVEYVLHFAVCLGGVGRGARRPLHFNYPRMRGCHWELEGFSADCGRESWSKLFTEMADGLLAMHQPQASPTVRSPSRFGTRYQDVVDRNTRVVLLPCPGLKHPCDVAVWEKEGHKPHVRGAALDLLYSDKQFKGKPFEGDGNPNVGGNLGVPSFVIIKSHFPPNATPYQAVTVFGVEHADRDLFVTKLLEQTDAQLVWPQL